MDSIHRCLSERARRALLAFADDWHGGIKPGRGWWQLYLALVDEFLGAMAAAGVLLKAPKCWLAFAFGQFMGHDIDADGGNKLLDSFVAGLQQWVPPTALTEVRSLLGTFNVGRESVPRYAIRAAPLQALLKKDESFWGREQQAAAEAIVAALVDGVKRYVLMFFSCCCAVSRAAAAARGRVAVV
jgi:hypothetical protein